MLYNMFFKNNTYLCSVETRENNRRCLTRPRNAGAQKPRIMDKTMNEIFMLQYRIKRYQSMGNGPMCQALNGKLQKLLAKQASAM